MSRRIPLAAAAGWLITAIIATGAGVTVIGVLGEPLADSAGRPLSAREVREALARATPAADATAAGPSPSADPTAAGPVSTTATEAPADAPAEDPAAPTAGPSATPTAVPVTPATPAPTAAGSPPGHSRLIATAGGNVIARCDGGLVTLRSWSPAQGFHVDKVDRGPDRRARVEFESESGEVRVEVRCSASDTPVHTLDD
ncbi:hypothetical protein ACWDR1_11400 [Streptosporangium sandarakinum]